MLSQQILNAVKEVLVTALPNMDVAIQCEKLGGKSTNPIEAGYPRAKKSLLFLNSIALADWLDDKGVYEVTIEFQLFYHPGDPAPTDINLVGKLKSALNLDLVIKKGQGREPGVTKSLMPDTATYGTISCIDEGRVILAPLTMTFLMEK